MKQLCALVALLLIACQPPPSTHYYVLAYTPIPKKAARLHDYVVRVRDLNISEAYRRPQLAFRYSPYEIDYFTYRLWGVQPQKGCSDLLFYHLRGRNLVRDVVQEYHDRKPDFELTGEVLAIEEFDSGVERFAHLTMSLRLSRHSDKSVVIEHSFDRRKKVYQDDPQFLIRALSEILEEETERFLAQMEQYLDENPAAR